MDLHLSGRVALLAGGSKGIGRSIALTLAREGVDIAICARGAEDLERTANEIRSLSGRRCLPVQADLSLLDNCRRFVQTAVDHYGRADILVCSANTKGAPGGPFHSIPDEHWTHHMDVKFLSVVRCSREVLPHMQKQRWGRILIISGMATRLLRPFKMDNGPVCAAMTNFGKQLSAQVVGDGIRVNTIHPDMTRTELLAARIVRLAEQRGVSLEQVEKDLVAGKPLGRFVEPDEIGNLVAFLCSDLADAITGQSIAVDGGASMAVNY